MGKSTFPAPNCSGGSRAVITLIGGAQRECLMGTARLRFGIWQKDDAPNAEAIWGDPRVTSLTGGPFTTEEVAHRLAAEIENWRLYRIQYWPVFHVAGGTLVGCCGLRPRSGSRRTAELGFQLCHGTWGQGFATEAANAVIARARLLGFSTLIAGHHPNNQASKRTLLRLGFAHTHEELYPPTGAVEPCYELQIGDGNHFPSD